MGTLVLVRHGQAGFLEAEYDILSERGARQIRALGRYWASRGRRVDRASVGPLVRQRRSWESFVEGFVEAGGQPFSATPERGLEEYQALEMMRLAVPMLAGVDPVVTETTEGIAAGGTDAELGHHKERLFQHLSRRWVRREFELPGVTPFATFRRDVEAALSRAVAGLARGETAVVFTSGGVVAAAVGHALRLDDEQTLELSWIVKNAAFTELSVHPDDHERRRLSTFNAVPHLDHDPGLLTLR